VEARKAHVLRLQLLGLVRQKRRKRLRLKHPHVTRSARDSFDEPPGKHDDRPHRKFTPRAVREDAPQPGRLSSGLRDRIAVGRATLNEQLLPLESDLRLAASRLRSRLGLNGDYAGGADQHMVDVETVA